QSESDECAPGMSKDNRFADPKLIERYDKKFSLSRGGPNPGARARAVPEPRPIETNDAAMSGETVYQPADRKILDHCSITVQQHHTRCTAIPTINIVQA